MTANEATTANRTLEGGARRLAARLAIAALLGAAVATGAAAYDDAAKLGRAKTLELEIVENGTKFTADGTLAFPDGLPAFGATFVTVGYVYPAGTISGTNGVLPDGSPEFPDKVIGTWTCRGFFVGDGAHTTTGPMVVTHQVLDFGAKPGDEAIMTDGFEYADVGLQIHRAVIGGTGQYAKARGEQLQTLLVFPNNAGGVSLRQTVEVTK
jgi:hypothetical protein